MSTLTGVEVTDLGDIPSHSPTGHLYHIYSKAVGEDPRQFPDGSKRADERGNLTPAGRKLWRMVQGNRALPLCTNQVPANRLARRMPLQALAVWHKLGAELFHQKPYRQDGDS